MKVVQEWADEAFETMGLDVSTAVVTLTHDPKLDDPALEAALKSDAFYVGALGSRRTHAKRKERLAEAGITDEQFARIHGPVGLNIGAKSPAEIAVSILGQIIEVRARRLEAMAASQGGRSVRFGETPIDEAAGAILAHSWRASGVNFSKGRVLSADDVAKLKAAGASTVVAARLDPDDVHEDEAAAAVAKALAGEGIEITAAFTGRCNHFATEAGLAVVDHERIDALNELDESVTVATLPPFARVEPRQMVATVKIIPYAAPRTAVARAIEVAKSANQPLVSIAPFKAMRAGLVQTRLPGTRDKVLDKAVGTTGKRLTSLGSALVGERRVTHDAKAIAGALQRTEGRRAATSS